MFPYDVTCPVCMELYYRPHTCEPCKHVFCEPCLREISKQVPITTPCPMCRKVISKCKLNAGQYTFLMPIFLIYFLASESLSVLRGHSIFSSPPHWPMTSDFEGFSIPDCIHYICFPILILEKEPVFPF